MIGTRANEKLFWKSRAAGYSRPFAAETLAKTRRILKILEGMGVVFSGRRLLDIGCGTGVYALPLAARARSVYGVDSSPEMLRILRGERARRGIKNARCVRSSWAALPAASVRGKFDIALASMTMAVKNRPDLLKMEAAALENCVYIGWAGKRRNALMERVYRAHGLRYRAPRGSETILGLLRELGRGFSLRYINDGWTKELTPEETLREIEIGMRVNGKRIQKERVSEMLKKFTKKGLVRQRTVMRKAVITWRVPRELRRPARVSR